MDISTEIAGLKLENPLMPAAGPLTGNPKLIERAAGQGVGAIVTKTISTEAAEVSKPAIAKLNGGVLNCEKWSEDPPERWIDDYFPTIARENDVPLVLSLGYNPDQIRELLPEIEEFASAFELSSHYLGRDPEPIRNIAAAASEKTDKPIFVKLSPHVPDLGEFASAAVKGGAAGIVAINSVGPGLEIDLDDLTSPLGSDDGYGWLSGPPIKPLALQAVNEVYNAVDVPVIGVGGIASARDLLQFVAAGASATQMLSHAISEGADAYGKIIDGVPKELEKLEVDNLTDLIGKYDNSS
ncbi:dihydroorotate dehydrogenase [Candidatus Bipolaricaulota bacterium]|nr:dihydroorotate dehydrogenase [Candidatus Bipolaricaulota bacterium]